MTCLFTEGFESVIDNTDLLARGWQTASPTTVNGSSVLTLPARTGQSGRGLMLKGPYASAAGLPNLSAAADFGMLNTKHSIYSLWQAGGFVVGMNGTFNQVNQIQVGCSNTYHIVYDGSMYYWAIGLNNAGVYTIYYSTNLSTWTPTSATPTGLGVMSKIMVFGSGASATIVVTNWIPNAQNSAWYSTNMGGNWTTLQVNNLTWLPLYLIGNKSSTAPVVAAGWIGSVGMGLFYSSTPGGAWTRIGSLVVSGWNNTTDDTHAYGRYLNDVILLTNQNSTAAYTTPISTVNYWMWCLDSTDPTNAANWVQSPTSILGQMNDIAYFPMTGQWYAAGYGGIASSTQTGTLSAPKGPSGPWITVCPTPGGIPVWSIACNGTALVAVGTDSVNTGIGAIYTSTNGTTWTKANRFILSTAPLANGSVFTNVIWDGARFILTGGQNNNVIATSPDGVAWTPVYYPDYTEAVGTACDSMLGVYSGTWTTATNVFAQWSTATANYVGVGVTASAQTNVGGTRTVSGAVVVGSGGMTSTQPTPVSLGNVVAGVTPPGMLSHYYEFIFTAAGAQNQFSVQWALDGIIQGSLGTFSFATSGDVGTAQLFINLPRTGNFVMIDDIYLTNFAGPNNIGQLGIVSVYPWEPVSDVQEGLLASNGILSHAAQVSGALSNSENYSYAFTNGSKDIYQMSEAVPANYVVKAVVAEAYFMRNGTVGGTGTVGIVNDGVELDSAAVSAMVINTEVYGSVLSEVDPNTNAAWTNAGLATANIAVTKTS
jgi:hypothetical protein